MGHAPEVLRSMRVLLELWDDLRDKPGPFHFELRGVSMWPAAPEGSILAVTPCPSSALRAGELVTFRRDRRILTHRVVELGAGGQVVAWGDSLLRPDPPIAAADVLGRATVVRRGPMVSLPRPLAGAGRRLAGTFWIAARRAVAAALRLGAEVRDRSLASLGRAVDRRGR
jgi:signal peptidase